MMKIAIAGALILLCGCAKPPAPRLNENLEQPTYPLARAPEQAMSCMAENAARDGYVLRARPLYGISRIGVIVRAADGVDEIISGVVEHAGNGSHVRIRSIAGDGNRRQLIEGLIKGC